MSRYEKSLRFIMSFLPNSRYGPEIADNDILKSNVLASRIIKHISYSYSRYCQRRCCAHMLHEQHRVRTSTFSIEQTRVLYPQPFQLPTYLLTYLLTTI